MKSAGKTTALLRPLGAAVLNLWVSSLIPPGLVASIRIGTLSLVHTIVVATCLLVPSSSRIVPALHVRHVRRTLVPLATILEPPQPRAIALPDAVSIGEW